MYNAPGIRFEVANMANAADRWTVRGVSRATQRKALALARNAGEPIGVLLSRLIDNAADSAALADIPSDALGAITNRLARHEHILVELLDRIASLENRPESNIDAKATGEPLDMAFDSGATQAGSESSTASRGLPGASAEHPTGTDSPDSFAKRKRTRSKGGNDGRSTA